MSYDGVITSMAFGRVRVARVAAASMVIARGRSAPIRSGANPMPAAWFATNFTGGTLKPPVKVRTETARNNVGYFLTGSVGSVQSLVYGFSGLRIREPGLVQAYAPVLLPPRWTSLTLRDLSFRGQRPGYPHRSRCRRRGAAYAPGALPHGACNRHPAGPASRESLSARRGPDCSCAALTPEPQRLRQSQTLTLYGCRKHRVRKRAPMSASMPGGSSRILSSGRPTSVGHLGECRPPQGISVPGLELPPDPLEVVAVRVVESVEHRDAATCLEDVSPDEEQPRALYDGKRAIESSTWPGSSS